MTIPKDAYIYLTGGGPLDGFLWDLLKPAPFSDDLTSFKVHDDIIETDAGSKVLDPAGKSVSQTALYKYVGADTFDGRQRRVYQYQYPVLT